MFVTAILTLVYLGGASATAVDFYESNQWGGTSWFALVIVAALWPGFATYIAVSRWYR